MIFGQYRQNVNVARPYVMVICGTEWQIPLIERLKNAGMKVLVVNRDEGSPAFAHADATAIVDILDIDSCLRLALEFGVIGVLSDQSDIAVETVARLSGQLGFGGISVERARLCTNKLLMRQHCDAHGFSQPNYELCTSFPSFREKINRSVGNLIVKPLDSNSSRGVQVVSAVSDLESAYHGATRNNRRGTGVLLEEYLPGTEYTVDGIIQKGVHKTLAISKKKHFSYNHSIACELYFSWRDPYVCYDRLSANNDCVFDSLGLAEGTMTHAEYKFDKEEFCLIEFAARGGGNLIASHIVPFMSGFDNYGYYISNKLEVPGDSRMPCMVPHDPERVAVLRFFDVSDEGLIVSIQGEDLLRTDERVLAFNFNYSCGEIFTFADNDATRFGYYIAVANSSDELEEIVDLVNREVCITIDVALGAESF